MQTILVINSKGGCGKTTLATNLASYFVNQNHKTALMDYDPQGSSAAWLHQRPAARRKIYGAYAATRQGANAIRSWQMNLSPDLERVVIDAPAGIHGLTLQQLVRKADHVLVPVTPSSIDIRATADFIRDLLLVGKARTYQTEIAVVANRIRQGMPSYAPLERFIKALNLPMLTRVRDSMAYVNAAEAGLGIFDLPADQVVRERTELWPIIEWLEKRPTQHAKRNESFAKTGIGAVSSSLVFL